MELNQIWSFFKMSMIMRGAMESKVYARDNYNDGPWNLKREEKPMRESKMMIDRTNGLQILVGSKNCWGQG